MSSFILDTSVSMKWFLEDEEDRAYSLSVLENITDQFRPIVPWLWYYEMANNLIIQVRRKRIMFEQAADYANILREMLIDVDAPDASAILQLPGLAHRYHLTSYDAAFLELAQRLQLPLATADKALSRAAADFGVQLLPFPRT